MKEEKIEQGIRELDSLLAIGGMDSSLEPPLKTNYRRLIIGRRNRLMLDLKDLSSNK